VDQALVVNARHEYTVQRGDQPALLGLQRHSVVDGKSAGYRTPRFLTFKQALELGGNVRKGERGTKIYFVKQLQVREFYSQPRRYHLDCAEKAKASEPDKGSA